MKKATSLLLALILAFSLALPAAAEEAGYDVLEGGVTEIQKYGNIILDIASQDLLDAGYEYGDLLTVTVNDVDHEMPLCTNYSDVDTGSLVLRDAEGVLIAAINMGDFATTNSLAEKVTAEDGSFEWKFAEGKSIEDITVSIAMAAKGGYHDQYIIHQLERTNERGDYDSDEIFANFRNIAAGELGENALFRSSSPVNGELGRAAYADDFCEASGIQAVMNLADAGEDVEGCFEEEGFDSPYYQSLYEDGKVKALNLGVDFTADDFKSGLADGLRFFAENEGPYLVHCTEGKDRAGFVSALLSCFMGADFDEVVNDYMTTYVNYYHLTEDSEQYAAVKNSNIVSILEAITGSEKGADLSEVDLAKAAEEYLADIGLSEEETAALKDNLSKDYELPAPAEEPGEEEPAEETPAEEPEEQPAGEPAPSTPSSEDAPAAAETPAEEAPAQPEEQPADDAARDVTSYTVVSGDCLWNIAYKLYGSGARWTEIYELNKETVKNPEMIYIGQVLTVYAA
jgi:LysM repeat protein